MFEENETDQPNAAPKWVTKAGLATGSLTILYLMVVAILLGTGALSLEQSGFVLVAILALSMALLTFFFGFHAVAKGSLDVPYIKTSPIVFSAGGGLASFIVILFLGNVLLPNVEAPKPDECSVNFRPGISFRHAVEDIANLESHTVIFSSSCEGILETALPGGHLSASECIYLIENLVDHLADPRPVKVFFDLARGRYDIQC